MSLRKWFSKKGSGVASTSPAEQIAANCFVLCREASAIDVTSVAFAVENILGNGYTADCSSENVIMISHEQGLVGFLALMPAPIPGNEAEENADGNFLWPNGRAEAAIHRAHVIVSALPQAGQSPKKSLLLLTRLALIGLKLFDGIGVYWGNASVSNSRVAFESFCEGMSEEHAPVPAWLRFQLVGQAGGKTGMYTLGMKQFGMMDIEVERCNLEIAELFEFVSNIAHYLIQAGPVIADGNTVGGTAEEQILVRHEASLVDSQRTVYKIIFDA